MTQKPQPWKPADATDAIRAIAKGVFTLSWTKHAREQMAARELSTGDILHALKRGVVSEGSQPSTRPNCYKYLIDCNTPNSGARTVRTVVVPCCKPAEIKVITVMWRDE